MWRELYEGLAFALQQTAAFAGLGFTSRETTAESANQAGSVCLLSIRHTNRDERKETCNRSAMSKAQGAMMW